MNVFFFCGRCIIHLIFWILTILCRCRWPRGLSRGTAAAVLLGLRVRTPPRVCLPVSCERSVILGTGLCVGLINRPEESYRM